MRWLRGFRYGGEVRARGGLESVGVRASKPHHAGSGGQLHPTVLSQLNTECKTNSQSCAGGGAGRAPTAEEVRMGVAGECGAAEAAYWARNAGLGATPAA